MSERDAGGSAWERVKQIFHEVKEAPEPDRERRLAVLCGEDELVLNQVRALLNADAEANDFLEALTVEGAGAAARAAAGVAAADSPEGPGSRIGPYKLLQRIGEGGFGVVYMAEQEEPIRRRVALKVIKPGMDTREVIARFEAERQALAILDHPNIAKVFDAGRTPIGRPYFVMELVRGVPITQYCDEQRLGMRERLELFRTVCSAVHHAHEQGIIHRDIKPSNVLVTLHDGVPVPKVIDFGVAKAIRQRLTEATLFTKYDQFIGTPEYMAPEQASYAGLDVDRRSDVYSLGALLYELLTGTTPLEARRLRLAAQLEVFRVLMEDEPPRPSTRVHTMGRSSEPVARHRSTDPTALARFLRGDLDWIVMKALEKDRTRRYDSASDLAADIARYFDQRPVVARPPSTVYRFRKLLRRRRRPFAAAAVAVLALLVDVAYVGWQRDRMAASATGSAAAGDQLTELLTTDDGPCRYDSGRPSPDGTRILSVDYCLGGVFVHDVAEGTSEMLTSDWKHWGAAWSPDGGRILLGADSPWIVDVETGARQVASALQGLSLRPTRWSPDGDHVTGVRTGGDGSVSMELVSLGSGERTVLAEGVRQGLEDAAFSPDGRYVLFASLSGEDEDIFVHDVETGESRVLVEASGDDSGALWSPDGKTVVYRNDGGMWAVPVSNGRATDPPRLVRRGPVWPSAWTEHGYYYSVSNTITRGHSLQVRPETGEPTGRREPVSLPAGDLPNVRMAWAPDMRQVAVTGWADGKVHIVRGGAVSSFAVGSEALPTKLWWSNSGGEVLFTSAPRGQRDRTTRTVFALDVTDGDVRELFPRLEGLNHIHVSPDGRRMVSLRENPDQAGPRFLEMVISDLGESDGRVLARADDRGHLGSMFGQPLFSPDGSRILFMRNPPAPGDGPSSLWVVEADGTGERRVATAPTIWSAAWDPTGSRIAYQTWENSQGWDGGEVHTRLLVVSLDDGATHEIEGFQELGDARLQGWSPDGSWLAVTERVGRWELWVNRDLLGSGQ